MARGVNSIVLSDEIYTELCRYWSVPDDDWDEILKRLMHYAGIAGLKPTFNTKEGIEHVRSKNS